MIDREKSERSRYKFRGFLTKNEREYLEDYPDDPGEDSEKRRVIRERIRSGFRDFALVLEHLHEHDRELLAEMYEGTPVMAGNPYTRDSDNLHDDMASTLAFISLVLADRGGVREPREGDGQYIHLLEQVLHDGFEKAYPELGLVYQGFELEMYSYDRERIEKLKDQIRSDLARRESRVPTGEAVRLLVEAGELERGALRDVVLESIAEEDD